MLRRVAWDEFEARAPILRCVNDAFDHQDRNPSCCSVTSPIVKDETAQVHETGEQGIEGCGLRKRTHHVAAPETEIVRATQAPDPVCRQSGSQPRGAQPSRRDALDILGATGIFRFGRMNAAVAHGARPLLVEIDRDNRRRFDFIGIAPFDLLRRLAVSAKRGCRRGRSLLVRSAAERLQSGACKLVRSAVDSVFRPVGRTIPLRCESGSPCAWCAPAG